MKRLHTRIVTAAVLASSLLLGACSGGEGAESDAAAEASPASSSAADETTAAAEASPEESSSEDARPEESTTGEAATGEATASDAGEPDARTAEPAGDDRQNNGGDNQAAAPAPQPNEGGGAEPAPDPAPQQSGGDPGGQAPAQSQDQPQGQPDRQAVIDGMAAATAASGEDVSVVPPEVLNQLYGCMTDSLMNQGATNLTTAIANQQDRQLSQQDSAAMQTAAETCYSQLLSQFGG